MYNTRHNKRSYQNGFDILFAQFQFKADLSSKNGNNFVPHSRFEPPKLETYMVHEKWVPDFGGLELRFLSEEGAARMIYHDFDEMISDYRDLEAPLDDDVDL